MGQTSITTRGVFGKRQLQSIPCIKPGEAVIYGRRSKKDERASKSLADQRDECLDVCGDLGIPVTEDDFWPEKPGHGGDEWYEGVVLFDQTGDHGPSQPTRPVLTKIVRGILGGQIRVVVVYSQCRLWRSAAICSVLIDLMAKHNVLLIDRSGIVDIHTPEGRSAVLQNAVNAQNQREMSVVNAPRGVTRSRDKGKLVTNPNVLGFRAVGNKTGLVRAVPEELEHVRRWYHLFVFGGEGRGPMSAYEIAKLVTSEGFVVPQELQEKRYFKRHESTKNIVYDEYVRHVLSDPRYVGLQPHEKATWPCDAFLVDGKPVVDPAVFEQAKQKLQASKRVGKPGTNHRAIAGRMYCGFCGQPMSANSQCVPYRGGATLVHWRNDRSSERSWCTHHVPTLREDILDAYLDGILAPVLLAEIRERCMSVENVNLMNQKAVCGKALAEAEYELSAVLPTYFGKVSPELLGLKEQELRAKIAEQKGVLANIDKQVRSMEALMPALDCIDKTDAETRRDIYRSCIVWIAVLPPDNDPKVLKRGNRDYQRLRHDAGRIVFLSVWGTYHTGTIYRSGGEGGYHYNTHLIRPATPEEMIGGIRDFPDPQAFLAGIERHYHGRRVEFHLAEVAPGYEAGKQPPVAVLSSDL